MLPFHQLRRDHREVITETTELNHVIIYPLFWTAAMKTYSLAANNVICFYPVRGKLFIEGSVFGTSYAKLSTHVGI